MNFGTIKKLVAAYLNRDVPSFSATGVDVLGTAVNNALLWAQRQHDFEWSRTRGQLLVDFQAGASLDNVTVVGGTTLLDTKKLEAAYIIDTTTGQGNYDGLPLRLYSRYVDGYRTRRRNPSDIWPPPGNAAAAIQTSELALIQHGNDVYFSPGVQDLYPTDTQKLVALDIVAFEPQLVADDDTSYFLDYFADFVIAKSAQDLNVYLKEDPRAATLDAAVQRSWQTMLQFDTSTAADDNGDLD